jgi:hypothetical protein
VKYDIASWKEEESKERKKKRLKMSHFDTPHGQLQSSDLEKNEKNVDSPLKNTNQDDPPG